MAMVDIPAGILASLMCSKCKQLLNKGPVYQQHDGTGVCGVCQAREEAQPASRCLLYEATAQLLRFPCRYQEEGCPTTVPFVAAESTNFTHEDACEYRQYVCPVLGSNRCDWAGRRNQLLQHSGEQHPDRVLPNPALITPDIRRSKTADYIISAFSLLFLVHTRVSVSTGLTAMLHYAVRLLDDPQKAVNYIFTLKVKRGDDRIILNNDVLPQEQLELQEHSALTFSTNSLLSVLGGWDNASLSVEVKAREAEIKQELALAQHHVRVKEEPEQCSKCRASTPRLYRKKQGWLCAGCVPNKYTCTNKGCDFQDIGVWKRDKHSSYFCAQSPKCYLCRAVHLPGTVWHKHYKNRCNKVLLQPSSKFLVQRTTARQGQWLLVETAAGYVLCQYYYKEDNELSLFVYSPVPCDQLYLHCCEVRLECAGDIIIKRPRHNFEDSQEDWAFSINTNSFFINSNVYLELTIWALEEHLP